MRGNAIMNKDTTQKRRDIVIRSLYEERRISMMKRLSSNEKAIIAETDRCLEGFMRRANDFHNRPIFIPKNVRYFIINNDPDTGANLIGDMLVNSIKRFYDYFRMSNEYRSIREIFRKYKLSLNLKNLNAVFLFKSNVEMNNTECDCDNGIIQNDYTIEIHQINRPSLFMRIVFSPLLSFIDSQLKLILKRINLPFSSISSAVMNDPMAYPHHLKFDLSIRRYTKMKNVKQ